MRPSARSYVLACSFLRATGDEEAVKKEAVVNQFTKVVTENEAMTAFTLLNKYRPATPAAKKQRIKELAATKAGGKEEE
jgi:large subunit ribosomal protein L7Ae